jgi:protein-S-isoprenylcysteine O-methyltransferase Ste14
VAWSEAIGENGGRSCRKGTITAPATSRLTIVATSFLPLTVLAGLFGMNFSWMISHIGSTWAFWGVGIGGLVTSGAAIAVWLRRSGMYGGRPHRSASRRRRGTGKSEATDGQLEDRLA